MTDTFNRFAGARSTYGMKKPVRAATTANVTLSGYQTIDGAAYSSTDAAANLNMRVLVKNQNDSTQNGIYSVNSGTWTREKDFDGNTDYTRGTSVFVAQGTVNGGKIFTVTSSDPQNIGVAATSFSAMAVDAVTSQGTDVLSASTTDLSAATGGIVDVTGSNAITAITLGSGAMRVVRFTGAATLTNGASLVLPGSQNIVTAAGDYAIFVGYASSVVRCIAYCRANSHPLTTGYTSLLSAATTELGSVREQSILITASNTITSFGSTAPTGAVKYLRFAAALILTNNITSLILPTGADINVLAGDMATVMHMGSGNWVVTAFTRALTGGVLSVNATTTSTPTSTGGSTAESTLMTYDLPASAMGTTGYQVRVQAWGVTAATALAKTIKLYFGGTAIANTGAIVFNNHSWRIDGTVLRSSAAAQLAHSLITCSSATIYPAQSQLTTPAETMSAPVTIKITGICTSTGATEISQNGMTISLVTA